MRRFIRFFIDVFIVCSFIQCTNSYNSPFMFQFDYENEMSGKKMAIVDINPNLPTNWDDYNFVSLEFKISSSQRFQLGFTTDWGYNELRIMSYVPNAWNKLAIPLSYFTELPDPAVDIAATMNHARYTGWINLGGKRGPMHGVDSIGVRMRKAIGNPTIEIRNIELYVEDPGDLYMEHKPAVDQFGQNALLKYSEKVYSLNDLRADWDEEDAFLAIPEDYNYSKFGGYKNKRVEATGFFRTEMVDGRWWFVDPEGYVFLSIGADCVNLDRGNVRDWDKRSNMFCEMPPADIQKAIDAGNKNLNEFSFGTWNLFRRYGEDFINEGEEKALERMNKWGMNTIANWSSPSIYNRNLKAFTLSLNNIGMQKELMGLSDVYAPDYEQKMSTAIQKIVEPNVNNPWVIGYFFGNEPAWINSEERLCQIILDGEERPIKQALKEYLYINGDTKQTRIDFVISTFEKYLKIVNSLFKKFDPNHINLGIRFGEPDTINDQILKVSAKYFDVFSFNSYSLTPHKHMLDRTEEITKIPMMIGEYHFGTIDRGYAQSLWQVNNEEERGEAYRYYTEQVFSHMGVIGAAYFCWSDQPLTGRGDGENYNCGLIDVTDRPYKHQVKAMIKTAKCLYDVHAGNIPPFDQYPASARGNELVPDLWNE